MRWGIFALTCFVMMLNTVGADAAASTLAVSFNTLAQGQLDEVRVMGDQITRVRAAFLDHQYVLLPAEDGSYRGFVAAPMDAPTGNFRLSVLVFYADGQQDYLVQDIRVVKGVFTENNLALPAEKVALGDQEIYLDELALLNERINVLNEGSATWLDGLEPPFSRPPGAGFGAYRQFNGQREEQRHTGVDFPAALGTPVKAAAAGRVVLAQYLPIRGNYVLVDHGSGLFSGYAHLAQRLVEAGDMLQQGSIIGFVGSTGRSSGTHLHWEVALGGVWVDPLELTYLLQ